MNIVPGTFDEDGQADPAALQGRQRPENEVPVTVALDAVLLEGPDAAVLLGNVQAFSTGIAFWVTAMTRRPDPADPGALSAALHRHGGGAAGFLLGVEYADGRWASTAGGQDAFFGGEPAPPDAVTLWPGGGGGGSRYADAAFHLSPLPPPGVLRFIAAWPSLDLPETTTEIPADPLLDAARRARRLWDWEPEPPWTPQPPQVPPGGWFGAHTRGRTG